MAFALRVVLDTGAFFRPDLLRMLQASRATVVVPAIALAERARQLAVQGRTFEDLLRVVELTGAIVEPFGAEHARLVGERATSRPLWDAHARDVMIAAHVLEDDVLCTTNPRDFLAIGLKPAQVRGV